MVNLKRFHLHRELNDMYSQLSSQKTWWTINLINCITLWQSSSPVSQTQTLSIHRFVARCVRVAFSGAKYAPHLLPGQENGIILPRPPPPDVSELKAFGECFLPQVSHLPRPTIPTPLGPFPRSLRSSWREVSRTTVCFQALYPTLNGS